MSEKEVAEEQSKSKIKLKICAHVYSLRETFDVGTINFLTKTIFIIEDAEAKKYTNYNFSEIFLCTCNKEKTCARAL